MKRSYYKLALKFHPDRVNGNDNDKAIAKENFSIVHHAYAILSDANDRQRYDNGKFDVLFTKTTRSAEWEHFLKPATNDQMNDSRKKYQYSEEETKAIVHEFQAGKGSMTHLMNNVPFMRVEDEPRIIEIIQRLIANGQVSKHKIKKK